MNNTGGTCTGVCCLLILKLLELSCSVTSQRYVRTLRTAAWNLPLSFLLSPVSPLLFILFPIAIAFLSSFFPVSYSFLTALIGFPLLPVLSFLSYFFSALITSLHFAFPFYIIVLQTPPHHHCHQIGDDTFQLEPSLLEDLTAQIATLASIYHKPGTENNKFHSWLWLFLWYDIIPHHLILMIW